MRMMSMSNVRELVPKPLDNSKELQKESVDKQSFKTEYDKKVDNLNKPDVVNTDHDKITVESKNDKTENISDKNNRDEIINDKDSKSKKQIDHNTDQSKTDLNPNTEKTVIPLLKDNKNTKEVSLSVKKANKKNINKNNSEEDVNKSDKNTLNQSIAAQLNIQVETEDKKLGINEKSNDKSEGVESNVKEINIETTDRSNVPKNGLGINLNNKKSEKSGKKKSSDEDSKIKVTDFRKGNKTRGVEQNNTVKNAETKSPAGKELNSDSNGSNESGVDKTILLGSTEVTAEGDGGKTQAPVIKEATQILKQQLKDFGNDEIVKQSRFILKDKDVGEIKLILKPESLGQVKINLNLKQNSLAGQIVVENNSVKEIFQENMSQLSKALKDQGYDTAELKLTLDDKKESNNREQNKNKQYYSDRLKRIDDSGNVVRYGTASTGIDLTA